MFSFQEIFSFEIFFKFLKSLLSVFVIITIFFQFLLKASTIKSNFL